MPVPPGQLSPGSGLTFKAANGSLDSMYVSGAAFDGGRIYAISAAHGTLLVIDPGTRAVVSAHAIPGLERPVGIAVKGGEAFIVDAAGALTIVPLA